MGDGLRDVARKGEVNLAVFVSEVSAFGAECIVFKEVGASVLGFLGLLVINEERRAQEGELVRELLRYFFYIKTSNRPILRKNLANLIRWR